MATWMVHLRIADILLNKLDGLSETDFIVGNIAPDSGVPNEDWTVYTPSKDICHFKRADANSDKQIDIQKFINKYYTKELANTYDKKHLSFYLGYLTHLLTDIEWRNSVTLPTQEKYKHKFKDNGFNWTAVKKDWYDLDFMFLRRNPDFEAFRIYYDAVGYENVFMTEFSKDAFDNRRNYITSFYKSEHRGIEREYTYLTEQDMERFICDCIDKLVINLLEIDNSLTLKNYQ